MRAGMHPVLRRVLLHGGLTALILAVIGVALAELANLWLSGRAAPAADPTADQQIGTVLRARVPLMLAAWGFLFVLVGEIIIWRVRGSRPAAPKPPENPQDDAERLLNELLAQAEAKMAAEAGGPPPSDREPGAGNGAPVAGNEQKTERDAPKAE